MPADPTIKAQILSYFAMFPSAETAYKIARYYHEDTYPQWEWRFREAMDELVTEGELVHLGGGFYMLAPSD